MSELTPQATPLKLASHINYNPDVLTCLANLSNDEVFTPPELANQMLDMLPADLWTNKNAKFLDPVTKSGVFLREIVKRLTTGLAQEIPDLQTRINHICTQQVHGIAITELTSLLARRSVYCAKTANSDLSICSAFDDAQGNIRFERTQHTWKDGKCTYCGASEAVYSRDEALETHAYSFIHMSDAEIERAKNMKFDVIIGNPPYQLSDGGAQASASPIYHKFVEQAKKLNPRYLTMIIPSRWFAGGKGLDTFRETMLGDKRIKKIVDFHNAADCFPGVEIKGGVCYFLWDESKTKAGCEVVPVISNTYQKSMVRDIGKYDVFVRPNEAITILEKVQKYNETTFDTRVSSQKPFGFRTNFRDYKKLEFANAVKIFAFKEVGWIEKSSIEQNIEWLDKNKVIVSAAYNGGYTYPHQIIGKPIIAGENSCCTETYIVCDVVESNQQAKNLSGYICTRFFRFMVFLRKVSQHNPKDRFAFAPTQNYNEPWTDEKLYAKYGLTNEEIAFIESMIRPMDVQTAEG
jgi:site-specific DNA-methyltransferase (adenine-specific)